MLVSFNITLAITKAYSPLNIFLGQPRETVGKYDRLKVLGRLSLGLVPTPRSPRTPLQAYRFPFSSGSITVDIIWTGPLVAVQPEIMQYNAQRGLALTDSRVLALIDRPQSYRHNWPTSLRGGFFSQLLLHLQVRTAMSGDHIITSSAGSYTFNTDSLIRYRMVQFR